MDWLKTWVTLVTHACCCTAQGGTSALQATRADSSPTSSSSSSSGFTLLAVVCAVNTVAILAILACWVCRRQRTPADDVISVEYEVPSEPNSADSWRNQQFISRRFISLWYVGAVLTIKSFVDDMTVVRAQYNVAVYEFAAICTSVCNGQVGMWRPILWTSK